MVIKTLLSLASPPPISIHEAWDTNDALIFLIDLEMDDQLELSDLSSDEKEYLNTLKTNYFKKRFIASRSSLKFIL